MSIKITLEIGHEAAIRTKRTPEGFTHDWEVFVRGCDNANIQYYIEKVIFHLHETFQKPKRVVKEPPYSVKESGYAGFTLPIEIHLRNKDEPKKITFNYDLTLQPTGPAICKLQKEKFVFNNPSEEFRHKLLKGGGMIVNSSTAPDDINHEKSSHSEDKIQLVSKPKLSIGEIPRKHKTKIEEPRIYNSFQELFGTPITKTTTKVFSESKSNNTNNTPRDENSKLSTSKHEKDKEKIKKHSSHKSKDKDKVKEKSKIESEKKSKSEKNREEKKEKRDKDEKNRDKKEKKEKSPRPRSSSPKHLSPKTPPSPVVKQDEKKGNPLKEKERKQEKSEQKLQAIEGSIKKKEKYDKDNFEKRNKEKSFIKSSDSKENKVNNKEKDKGEIKKEKEIFAPPHGKIEKREKNKDVIKEPKTPTIESDDLIKKDKSERNDEKKHKHKKKDKDKKDKEKKKESKSKSHKPEEQTVNLNSSEKNFENNKETIQVEEERSRKVKNEYSAPKFTEKSPELKKEVNSDSSLSSPVSVHDEILLPPPPPPPPEPNKDELDSKSETLTKHKKEKKEKKSKGDKESKKLKRKSEIKNENEPVEKIKKDETKEYDKEDKHNKEPEVKGEAAAIKDEIKTDEEPAPQEEEEDAGENDDNREAYMNRLKDLQQRIMTLEDNDELQKVVELIAKTGKYEVSARTFDFDLCLLERATIRKLQEFFDI